MAATAAPATVHAAGDVDPVGTVYPAEWTLRDVAEPAAELGYEVVQLTTDEAMDNKMYLRTTNYVPDTNSIVFMSRRDGVPNLFLMALDDDEFGEFVRLTDADEDDPEIDAEHANVAPAADRVYFEQDETHQWVSLSDPGEPTTVYDGRADADWDLKGTPSPSPDGRSIVTAEYDKCKDMRNDDEDCDDDTEGESRIFTIDADAPPDAPDPIAFVDGKIDHLWINPVHGDTIIYHVNDEDGDDDEVGLVDVATGDTTVLAEHGVHPFWSADGLVAGYMVKTDGPDMIVTHHLRTGARVTYSFEEYHSHMAMNPARTFVQGDGGTSAKKSQISYYPVDGTNGVGEPIEMFHHGACKDHGEQLHPHAEFVNDTDLLFNSDEFFEDTESDERCEEFDGDEENEVDGNVYLLRRKPVN